MQLYVYKDYFYISNYCVLKNTIDVKIIKNNIKQQSSYSYSHTPNKMRDITYRCQGDPLCND